MSPNRSFFLPILQSYGTVTVDRRERVRFVLPFFFDPFFYFCSFDFFCSCSFDFFCFVCCFVAIMVVVVGGMKEALMVVMEFCG
jgi:hypothetical protein